MIEESSAIFAANCSRAIAFDVRVSDTSFGGGWTTIDRDAAPRTGGARRPCKANAGGVSSLRNETAAIGNGYVGTGTQINGRARLDCQRRAGVDRDVIRDFVRTTRRRPGSIAADVLRDKLVRTIIVPDIEGYSLDLDVV